MARGPKPNRLGQLVALLSRPEGATSTDIETAFGMKPVSARALVATLRKTAVIKNSKSDNGPTTYRIEPTGEKQ